jgi:cell division protein FtsQ
VIKKQKRVLNLPFAHLFKIAAGVFLTFAISISLIFAHDVLTQCDYFKVTDIKIEGIKKLSEGIILAQAGVSRENNILSASLPMTRARLIMHPWIADAEVVREIPSGLVIKITEHEPVAILDLGRLFIINEYGEIFKEADESDLTNMPVVKGLEYSDLNVEGESRSETLAAVMDVLKLNSKTGNMMFDLFSVEEIKVDRDIGLTLHSKGPIKAVRIGFDDYAAKYQRLKDVFHYLDKKSKLKTIDSIDLVRADRIVMRPGKTSAAAG